MSDETRRYVDKFWELIDEILNAPLFAPIGLELLLLPSSWLHVAAAFALGGAVLVSHLLTVGPAILVLRRFRGANRQVPAGTIRILVWGGLRGGGVSVALALSLPLGPERDLILSPDPHRGAGIDPAPGLSIGPLVRRIYAGQPLEKSEGRMSAAFIKRAPAVMAGVFRWRAIRRCPVALRCEGAAQVHRRRQETSSRISA